MDALLTEALTKVIEYAPAVAVLLWVAWRADGRAEECIRKLFEHLDREH